MDEAVVLIPRTLRDAEIVRDARAGERGLHIMLAITLPLATAPPPHGRRTSASNAA